MFAAHDISRVAVVDDDELGRDDLMDELRDRSFEPLTVGGAYGSDIDRLLADLLAQSPDFVICDHKLQPGGLATFYGLDVVRRLISARYPAMLVTMYQTTDRTRMELRAARDAVPVILARDAFKPERLERYVDIVRREVAGDPVDERRPHRTVIRVDYVDEPSGNLDAMVPAWSPDHALTIPAACIGPHLRGRIKVGDHLAGDVNIGAGLEDELYFSNVDEIVEPKLISGIP
jgi:hypothetical protein